MTYDLTLRLWRGDSGGGDIVDYVVGVDEGEVVLDAVHHVQAQQAGDLGRSRGAEYLLPRTCLEHAAAVEDDDLVGQQRGLLWVVGDDHRA